MITIFVEYLHQNTIVSTSLCVSDRTLNMKYYVHKLYSQFLHKVYLKPPFINF